MTRFNELLRHLRASGLVSRLRDPRTKRVLLALVPLLLVFIVVFSAASSDDRACALCHRAIADAQASSTHSSSSCYGCHLPSGIWSRPSQKIQEVFRMYPLMIVRGTSQARSDRISRGACMRCHQDVMEGKVIAPKGLRIKHSSCAPSPDKCDRCHSDVGHGDAGSPIRKRSLVTASNGDDSSLETTPAPGWSRVPIMDDCIGCHEAADAATDCDTCHTGRRTGERLRTGPWQATHGPNWRNTHGMGDLNTCSTCHEKSKCMKCHGTELPHADDFIQKHGAQAMASTVKCMQCHRSEAMCAGCHGIEMPHPKTFLPNHPKIAKNIEDPVCMKCHKIDDCLTCHVSHTHPGRTDGHAQLPKKVGAK